jgi:hypothetical protein
MQRNDSPEEHFPRDKDILLRDFTVASRLREIRDEANLRYSLAPKWWETLIGVVMFGAAVGLMAALIQHPAVRQDELLTLIAFWGVLALVSLVMSLEFLILKLYHLRRANEVLLKGLQEMDHRVSALEKAGRESQSAASPASEESPR